jgi:hypothetical protein
MVADDVEQFIELRIRQLREEGATDALDLRPALRDYYTRHMADGTFVAWLAVEGGRIVGTSGMSFAEKPPYFSCPTGRLGLLSSITGVDSKGLADTSTDVTATAVMYTSKVFQNNVRHYFQHLRTSFKALGDTVLSLLGHPDVNVEVAQGPEEYMELQVARQELATLVGVVEPAQKRSIVNAILRTHPDNDILANLYAELNAMPQPTEMEMQMQDTIAKMKEAIDAKDKEIMQLTAQVDAYEKSSADFDKSLQAEFLKARQQHEFRMEENAQKAMLDQGGDAVKSAAEADKAQMDLEQKAVQLEAQKVKSATEIMKAMGV